MIPPQVHHHRHSPEKRLETDEYGNDTTEEKEKE